MDQACCKETPYAGFEQGPIRPPSEAQSLLLRITRNCPWNRCAFCPVYKDTNFSVRPVEHVKRDIDAVHTHIERLRAASEAEGHLNNAAMQRLARETPEKERAAFAAALDWYRADMHSVFLQDANSLFIRTAWLVEILEHLRMRFPKIRRVTSYARAHTMATRKVEDLQALAQAGLNRIHIGLESGSDTVLAMMKKGVTKAQHIEAGRKVKAAGIELSEYVMPGLGGRAFSEEHARETADALNRINPDFIRLRTLAIPTQSPLYQDCVEGRFEKMNDRETAEEIQLFLSRLDGVTSMIKSDHILNLFPELEGRLPGDLPRMQAVFDTFFSMSPEQQMLFQVGRRTGFVARLRDIDDPQVAESIDALCRQYGVTPENVDHVIDDLMRQFI